MNWNKITLFFSFKLRQVFRLINYDTDRVLAFFVLWGIAFFYDLKSDWYFLVYLIIPSLYYQIKRKDINFLSKVFYDESYIIMLTESSFLFLITSLIICTKVNNFLVFITGFLFCLLLPLIKIKNIDWTKKINLSFIPKDAFEWTSYIRAKPISFFSTYLALAISSYNPFTLAIMTFLFCGNINNIYSKPDTIEIYRLYFYNKTIENKLISSITFVIKFTIPIFIFSVLINFYLSHIILLIFCFMIMFLSNRILLKYSDYNLNYVRNKPPNIFKITELLLSIILVLPWWYTFSTLKNKITQEIKSKC